MNGEEPIVRPHAVLRWRRRRDVPTDVLRGVVLVADRGLAEEVRRRRRGKLVDGPSGTVAILRDDIGIAAPPGLGAPAAAIAVEELAALGARVVTAVGYAGSLVEDLGPGDIVVLERAFRGEGVSRHYLPDDPTVGADTEESAALVETLRSRGIPARTGAAWTTDALYRETPELVRHARAVGAVVVDLESAAILAVARSLGIAASVALVAGDRLAAGRWEPPADVNAVRRQARAVVDAVLDGWLRGDPPSR